ncbi:hypothetical protein N9L26_02215 [Candidatus Pacebacteria bacterium]|nr:hypothetical protein [Candidatus Paceibacterota bacterium]
MIAALASARALTHEKITIYPWNAEVGEPLIFPFSLSVEESELILAKLPPPGSGTQPGRALAQIFAGQRCGVVVIVTDTRPSQPEAATTEIQRLLKSHHMPIGIFVVDSGLAREALGYYRNIAKSRMYRVEALSGEKVADFINTMIKEAPACPTS